MSWGAFPVAAVFCGIVVSFLLTPSACLVRLPHPKGSSYHNHIVRIVAPVSYDESLAYLVRSHLLVVVQPDTELQIPGKLFEYVYLGRPVLALTGRGATADTVTRYHLGDVVGPRDVNQIVDVIRHRYREFRSGSWTERVNKNETLPVKI